ncbi:MAG: copper resistance protein CopB [Ponticaulis sp.]|nr:copper resistance protein CopB [Ponticaulis sp.]|tara:strand:- start:3248 stop:4069 length:822 start_codon:yes stop_codon:yes gene_type:complete
MIRSVQIAGLTCLAVLAGPVATAQHDHNGSADPNPSKPWSQADEIWGEAEMQASREHVRRHHGSEAVFGVIVDRAEVAFADEGEVALLEGDIWYGGDLNKFYVKTEAEYSFDHSEFEEFEVQALWSRAITPFWDFQAGLRHDFEPDGLSHAVVGFQGMAPYRFEVDMAAYLSENGDLTADLELEYELMLTQRLHLKPRAEIGFSAQDVADRSIGGGLTNGAAGIRLSYDVIREFSPYVGVEWIGALGETRDLRSAMGEETEETVFLIGFSAWY